MVPLFSRLLTACRRTGWVAVFLLCFAASADERGIIVQAARDAGLTDYDPSHFYALVIGINQYREWSDLRSARPDAQAVAETLRDNYGFPQKNIQLITDTKATRHGILEALDGYQRLGSDDCLIVYYAGHGWMDADRNGYWVPSEAPLDDKFSYISNAQITSEFFKKYKVKHLLVIADSCFAGAILRGNAQQRTPGWELPKGFNKPSRWIMTSGDLAPVEDDSGTGHSPFATRLLQYLKYSDQPAFGVNDLYVYVRKNLKSEAIAAPIDTPQHMPGGEFVFARLGVPLVEDKPVLFKPPPQPPVSSEPAKGDLVLISRFKGAFDLDGKFRQNVDAASMYTFRDLQAGLHTLRIRGAGAVWERQVDIPAGGSITMVAEAPGVPSFNTPVSINGLSMELLPIKSGRYLAGGSGGEADEMPGHMVTISRPFWMGRTEVTAADFVIFLNESRESGGVDFGDPLCPVERSGNGYRLRNLQDASRLPMSCVSYEAAKAFAAWLTRRESEAGRLPSGYAYRLPSEAEWEYACHAGTSSSYSFPSNQPLGSYVWYHRNGQGRPHATGALKPNPWGLYDMHGNVWEWCLDWYGIYPSSSVTDPTGPGDGRYRVVRGGSIDEDELYQRSANRGRAKPGVTRPSIGFRLILGPRL